MDHAHRFVMQTLAAALGPLVPGVRAMGISDLAIGGRKFSGNSMRCKRDHLLYHGTLLYDFPLELIEACLAMPPRQPDYRNGRAARSVRRQSPLGRAAIRRALIDAWGADEPADGLAPRGDRPAGRRKVQPRRSGTKAVENRRARDLSGGWSGAGRPVGRDGETW